MALVILPNAGQTLGNSRSDIRGNFDTINTAFSVDHVEYALGDQGKHNRVTLPNQAAGSGVATGATEGMVYSRQGVNSGTTELFYKRQSIAAGTDGIPFTESIETTSPGADTDGWTYLPSGILMKWGVRNATFGGTTYNLNGGGSLGPNFTQIMSVQATVQIAGSTNIRVSASISGANSIILEANVANAAYFFAIGR